MESNALRTIKAGNKDTGNNGEILTNISSVLTLGLAEGLTGVGGILRDTYHF